MQQSGILISALAMGLAFTAQAQPSPEPARVILVGDSTMAMGSGWGDAFCADAKPGLTCVNLAKGGRSSKSYRAEGSWDKVLADLRKPGRWGHTYVLIQFGHNDQPGKDDRSSDFATEFGPNMARYVSDVRAVGAEPVLVTPLTRRQFKGGVLQDGLAAWSAAVRKVAAETKTPLLDLASDSVLAVQIMGPAKAMDLAQAPPPADLVKVAAETGDTREAPKPAPGAPAAKVYFDYTHLGSAGARVFAAIVEGEVDKALPALAAQLRH